jgi:hypothetical protein
MASQSFFADHPVGGIGLLMSQHGARLGNSIGHRCRRRDEAWSSQRTNRSVALPGPGSRLGYAATPSPANVTQRRTTISSSCRRTGLLT